jgi:hypothetical protein
VVTLCRALIASLIALAVVGTAPVSSSAGTARRTTVTRDCLHLGVRPRSVVFACADGGFFVRGLEWREWHRRAAFAHGVFHQNDCDPNCAGGSFSVATGTLRLTHRRWCANWGRYVFRRAVVVFDTPLLGRSHEAFDLSCPLRPPNP